jgi:hypothetical protein
LHNLHAMATIRTLLVLSVLFLITGASCLCTSNPEAATNDSFVNRSHGAMSSRLPMMFGKPAADALKSQSGHH